MGTDGNEGKDVSRLGVECAAPWMLRHCYLGQPFGWW